MAPTKRPRQTQTAVRLPDDLYPRLDRIAERWTKAGPVPVNRSGVIRALLERAVQEEEKRHGRA
jgi:metal-responsive CopG/Arc/MetJ family transcriptional regulator